MPIITIHHSEQEGECHNAEYSWIDFSISGYVVHVDNVLVDKRDVVSFKVSWRCYLVLLILIGPPFVEFSGMEVCKVLFNNSFLLNWCPYESDVGGRSALHHVKDMVDSLLLGNEPTIDLKSAHIVVTLVHTVHLVKILL